MKLRLIVGTILVVASIAKLLTLWNVFHICWL